MAALTERFVTAEYTVRFCACMTLNTFSKAMLLSAYALMHCFIPLMHEEIHMRFAHFLGVLDTLNATALAYIQLWHG